MTEREAIKRLSGIRDSEYIIGAGLKRITFNEKAIEAFDLAISALEKQSVDKCCETCKYEHLELDAYPCCDCIRAKDHYEPHTEEES